MVVLEVSRRSLVPAGYDGHAADLMLLFGGLTRHGEVAGGGKYRYTALRQICY